jgi:hypothetical protein
MRASRIAQFFLGMILTASKRHIYQRNSVSCVASQSAIAEPARCFALLGARQKGFTITMTTITIISTVGTSLAKR